MDAIVTKNLTKRYKDKVAVNGIDFSVKKGELFSLLGVNGAGKTTTIKMLSCLIKPDDGDALLDGHSILNDAATVKKITNVSPQETAVAPNLTVRENLEFISGIYGSKKIKEKTDLIIEQFNLSEVENQRAKTLSGGWQRRLSIAMALISEPEILFLDEPTLGLDVLARRELWAIIENLKGKITIILTTHYMEEAEKLSDRVAIILKGDIITVDTPAGLIEKTGEKDFESAFVKIAEEGKVV